MTVIAYDGKTIAADKRACLGSLVYSVTKIYKHGEEIMFAGGDLDYILSMMDWYKKGGDPDEFPEHQKTDENFCAFHVIKNGKLYRYERTPVPILIEQPVFATGSGRDYALAAMACGKNAKEAVELACNFDPGCGNGIDIIQVDSARSNP